MRYKIGDLAHLFNLSTESIRHYERQGLIHPQKIEGSSYRYYSAWDLAILSACRHYRALGFTLDEGAQLLSENEPSVVLNELCAREQAIEQEIARQCQMLRTIRAWRREAESSCALVGRFELEQNVPTRFLPYQYGDALTQDETHLACVREWLSYIPYIYVGILIPPPGRDMLSPFTVGLCLAEAAVDFLSPKEHASVIHLPSRPCIHTAFRFEAGSFSPEAVFASISRELDARGLMAAGDMLCRFNIISWTKGGLSGVLDCFLPIA